MSENEFGIGAEWQWRPECPEEIGQRFLSTLDALSAISPHFSSWGLVDLEGEPKETTFALEDVRARFTEFVERGVSTDDDGTPEPQMGYWVIVGNHDEDPMTNAFSVNLRVHAGGSPGLSRSASFGTGYNQTPDPSIVAYPVFKPALLALVRNWDVASAQASSSELARDCDYPRYEFELAWMTYLSAPLAAQITPPRGVVIERIEGGGLLLIAAEETFDTENPNHMAAAHAIRDALAPLNDLPQHERKKRQMLEDHRKLKATGFPGKLISRSRNAPS